MLKKLLFKIFFFAYSKLRKTFFLLISPSRPIGSLKINQATQFVGKGKIIIEGNVTIGIFPSPFFFSSYAYLEARNRNAEIRIGQNTFINNGFTAIAEDSKITIGRNCLIGPLVEIINSDFHLLNYKDRAAGKAHTSSEVIIGDDVFIGSNVRILKGVRIGDGAVIGNSSIVTKDVPPSVIFAGQPGRVVRGI